MLIENQDNLVKEWDFLPWPEQAVLCYEIEHSTNAVCDIEKMPITTNALDEKLEEELADEVVLPVSQPKISRPKRELSIYSQVELREWVNNFKTRCGCCGEPDSIILVFHHKNPNEKTMNISEMTARRFAKEEIMAEIEKCIVLCWNCHMRIHAYDREEQKALQ